MARAVNSYSVTWQSTNQSAKTTVYRLRRYASTSEAETVFHSYRNAIFTPPTPSTGTVDFFGPGTQWVNADVTNTADVTWYYRAAASFELDGVKTGFIKTYLTRAIDPTVGTPSLSGETSSTVTVDASWTPGTSESTDNTITVQYKKSVDSTWINWGSTSDTDSGYSSVSIDQTTITGLDAETSYDFRLKCDRPSTSNPTTTFYGTQAATSTIADTPSVTTDAATSVAHATATLNATVDHNTVDGALSWRYIDTVSYSAPPDDAQGTEVAYASNPITEDGSGSYGISGLSASTGYTFWAIYDPTGAESTVFGAAATFTTQSDPAAEAADEDLMITQYVDGQYGVATTVYFTLRQPAATSSDAYYTGTAPVQADVKISQDGVYDSTSDNAPAQIASITQMYSLVVSAAEMQGDVIDIIISDAAGSAFRDQHIQVRTQQNLGTVVVNAAQKGTNTDAVTYTGNGTGAGLNCVAGDGDGVGIRGVMGDHVQNYGTVAAYDSTTVIDLDNSTAVDVADTYNGSIILFHTGTGSGQARVITDYVAGGEYRCTLNKALTTAVDSSTEYIIIPGADTWFISPGAELSGVPTFTSTMMEIMQFLFQRFAYQREQTATAFTMRKVDDAAQLATGGVDDDGTTQTHNRLA